MTYNPNTHLLRPLLEGEEIKPGDVFVGPGLRLTTDTANAHAGKLWTADKFTVHFRPVPVPTASGWLPRREGAQSFHDSILDVDYCRILYRWPDGMVISETYPNAEQGWTHYFVVPKPPAPDPLELSRQEFEKLCEELSPAFGVKLSYHRNAAGQYLNGCLENSWTAWQSARENKPQS